ncbi:MAG: hypothetical protein HOC74_41015 [Gemmatimonadetes bacterium]|jgi:hypothetical protein|nr:hypothetical protein [Gemmatimonadota bacterium]
MTASILLSDLEVRGIHLSIDGDQLHLDAPVGALTPELRTTLAAHKAELLAHLRQQPSADKKPVDTSAFSGSPIVAELDQHIYQATAWSDLTAVLNEAQRRFQTGELTAEEVKRLGDRALERSQRVPETADSLCLNGLFEETPIRRVLSKILGEEVLFAIDDAQVPPDNALVVYRQSELRLLADCSPERLQAIHASKKLLDGDLIEVSDEEDRIPTENLLSEKPEGGCPCLC